MKLTTTIKLLLMSLLLAIAPAAGLCAEPDGVVSAEEAERLLSQGMAFAPQPIPDSVFARMLGKSLPANASGISRQDLRYLRLLHHDLQGQVRLGEMVCNKQIATTLANIFRQLYEAGYPIECMRLIDDFDADDVKSMTANNTSCFCYRLVAGTKRLSKHAQGLAVDINPLYNPWVQRGEVSPEAGRPYADRKADFPCKITAGDLATRLFLKQGFTWGGNWKTMKDYQHFQK